jgi:hypothetical protein
MLYLEGPSLQKDFPGCFGLFLNRFVCFGCFDTVRNTETSLNNRKDIFCFIKQTEKQPKQIEFRFFSVKTENIFLFVSRTSYL